MPGSADSAAIVLAHGAGSDRNAPLLIRLAAAFEAVGIAAVRVDLAFRQARPKGPPFPAHAARDREGLLQAALALRGQGKYPVYLGGISYGGRQASMLAAENPSAADGLMLLSYPLHAPGRPDLPRTAHLPHIQTRALFVHGTRDPFGSPGELRAAIAMIPARTKLLLVDGAGHDLKGIDPPTVAAEFQSFVSEPA
jgi:uncharacterized protein